MPFDLHDAPRQTRHALPSLAPQTAIERPLSVPEYYHASVGASGTTLEIARENGFCVEGAGQFDAATWQRALDRVAAVNPGVRLRMSGQGRRARWHSDGLPPRVRLLESCGWDARSDVGAEVLYAAPLSLTEGPTVELLVIQRPAGRCLLVLRSHHAVTDGMGNMHLLHELFRALRGEPLLGTNAAFSDVDLMRSVGVRKSTSGHTKTEALTGPPQGDEHGDRWQRISLGMPRRNQLARVADAVISFAHARTDLPVLIGVPVDLRRHAPGLHSPANYTNMLLVRIDKGETGEHFRQRLRQMLDARMEAAFSWAFNLFKWFSLARLDRMLSRTEANYRTRKALETAVISNLGRQDAAALCAPGFEAERMFAIPVKGSIFMTMACLKDQVELVLNMPRVLASNGRFDAFVAHLLKTLDD